MNPEPSPVLEAREPVRAPEASSIPVAAAPAEPVVALAPAPMEHLVDPDDLPLAEKAIAMYLREHLDPALIKGVQLTLLAIPKNGRTDVKLVLHEGTVAANGALVGTQVLGALKQHPVLSAMFARKEPPHVQHPEGSKEGSIEIHITQLELGEYSGLIRTLAKNAAAYTSVKTTGTHADTCAGCEQCSTKVGKHSEAEAVAADAVADISAAKAPADAIVQNVMYEKAAAVGNAR